MTSVETVSPEPRVTDRAVLLVDDEPAMLAALTRSLRNDFEISTAGSSHAALALLSERPFAVIVSDLRMPGVDGIGLLAEAQRTSPDTVRMLLTGNADLDAAVDVVNRGQIFRFLTKPADLDVLRTSIESAIAQYELVVAERELLELTLRGSVQTLLDILALANPTAFARATRITGLVTTLLAGCDVGDHWEIEVAAMLSQIGAVTLPAEVAEKLHWGVPLDEDQRKLVGRMPAIAFRLLRNIPRLEGVREIIRLQQKHFDGSGSPATRISGSDIPLGARLLRLATDLDWLDAQSLPLPDRARILRSRQGVHDPALLDLFERESEAATTLPALELTVGELRHGMVLADDVLTTNGLLLVGRGHLVTETMLERICNYARMSAVVEPVYATRP